MISAPSSVVPIILNNQDWVPVAWTKIEKNNFSFKLKQRNLLFALLFYYQGRAIPAAYPVLLRKDGTITTLKPDLKKAGNRDPKT